MHGRKDWLAWQRYYLLNATQQQRALTSQSRRRRFWKEGVQVSKVLIYLHGSCIVWKRPTDVSTRDVHLTLWIQLTDCIDTFKRPRNIFESARWTYLFITDEKLWVYYKKCPWHRNSTYPRFSLASLITLAIILAAQALDTIDCYHTQTWTHNNSGRNLINFVFASHILSLRA